MVLTDGNFATIVHAIKEGRAIYDNIVKFVRFQLSTNMGAIQTVLGASLLGWTTPFTAIQILWINIIMDGPPAMSLGVEPARPGIMGEPPRASSARILTNGRLLRLFVYGLTMAVGTLSLFYHAGPQGSAYALTLAFTTFVLYQFFSMLWRNGIDLSIFPPISETVKPLFTSLISIPLGESKAGTVANPTAFPCVSGICFVITLPSCQSTISYYQRTICPDSGNHRLRITI